MAVPAGGSWIGVKNETLGAGTLTLSGGMRGWRHRGVVAFIPSRGFPSGHGTGPTQGWNLVARVDLETSPAMTGLSRLAYQITRGPEVQLVQLNNPHLETQLWKLEVFWSTASPILVVTINCVLDTGDIMEGEDRRRP